MNTDAFFSLNCLAISQLRVYNQTGNFTEADKIVEESKLLADHLDAVFKTAHIGLASPSIGYLMTAWARSKWAVENLGLAKVKLVSPADDYILIVTPQ